MKCVMTFFLVSALLLAGCAQFKEAAKEQVQEGKLAASESFTPVAGKGWQKVAVFEGKDQGAETVSFNIPDKRWKISWEATIPKREIGTFSVDVYRADGSLLKETYQEILYGQTDNGKYSIEIEIEEGSAKFYLKTGARNIVSWKATIETLSPTLLAQSSNEYPYLAKLPSGVEGKIVLRYRWTITSFTARDGTIWKKYSIDTAITNLSAKDIVVFEREVILKNAAGKIVQSGGGDRIQAGTKPWLSAGETKYSSGSEGELRPGYEEYEATSVELIVKDVQFKE